MPQFLQYHPVSSAVSNQFVNPSTAGKTRPTHTQKTAPPNQNPRATPAKFVSHKSGQIRDPRSRICPVEFGPCVTTHNERRQSTDADFLASRKPSNAR
jgi:hypothetical protein